MAFVEDHSVTLIIASETRLLMNLRDDKPGIWEPDRWSFIGGHVESNESLMDTLRREVEEEIGFELELGGPCVLEPVCSYIYEPVGTLTTVFLYEHDYLWQEDLSCNEGVELKWCDVPDILSGKILSLKTGRGHLVAPDHVEVLRRYLKCLP